MSSISKKAIADLRERMNESTWDGHWCARSVCEDAIDAIASAYAELDRPATPPQDTVTVPCEYLAMLESAANRFCSSCREKASCTMTACSFGGLGCGAWKLDGIRINALRTSAKTTNGDG